VSAPPPTRHLKQDESSATEQSATEWVGEGGRRRRTERERKPDEKGRGRWISSMSEIPVHPRLRRLADWINATGAKKVHFISG
jgi:hypothetical protein